MSVANIRQNYEKGELLEENAKSSPFEQFSLWLKQAIDHPVPEPTAMALSTVGSNGRPSSRIVLLKGVEPEGLVFYTNYESRKGRELANSPWASLLFFWQPLERQVRIEGVIEKVPPEVSDSYFASRPLGSRIGAWASRQSQPVELPELQKRFLEMQEKYGDNPPRPEYWGGYCLKPDYFEFWQGRPSRLHDRLAYSLDSDGKWVMKRLSP